MFDLIFFASRVRAKLRAGAPGYDFTSSFFLRCLYDGENGDPEDPEEGFLKGPLLLLVSQLPSLHSVSDNCSISGISAHFYITFFGLQ